MLLGLSGISKFALSNLSSSKNEVDLSKALARLKTTAGNKSISSSTKSVHGANSGVVKKKKK